MSVHPLATARAEQEESKLNRSLGLLIRQAIIDACKTRGQVHADDIEGLYPVAHHSRCRKLAPAQFGSLSSLKLIEQVEYRKSVVPERKGSKSWSWKFTKAGWDKYATAGVGAGSLANTGFVADSRVSASVDSGGVAAPERQGVPAERPEAPGVNPDLDVVPPDQSLAGVGGGNDDGVTPCASSAPGHSSHSGEIVGSSDNAEGSKADGHSSTLDRPGGLDSSSSNGAASSLAADSQTDDGSEGNATAESPAPSEPARPSEPEPLFGSAAYLHIQDAA